jgi:hypothetical protein
MCQDLVFRRTAGNRRRSSCKLQIWLLVREGAPYKENFNCLKIIIIKKEKFITDRKWLPDSKIEWPADR